MGRVEQRASDDADELVQIGHRCVNPPAHFRFCRPPSGILKGEPGGEDPLHDRVLKLAVGWRPIADDGQVNRKAVRFGAGRSQRLIPCATRQRAARPTVSTTAQALGDGRTLAGRGPITGVLRPGHPLDPGVALFAVRHGSSVAMTGLTTASCKRVDRCAVQVGPAA
jgi:hypothetical protein